MNTQKDATPLEVLQLIVDRGPIHHTMFRQCEDFLGRRITNTALRVCRRAGWIHTPINHVWVATSKGIQKAQEHDSSELYGLLPDDSE